MGYPYTMCGEKECNGGCCSTNPNICEDDSECSPCEEGQTECGEECCDGPCNEEGTGCCEDECCSNEQCDEGWNCVDGVCEEEGCEDDEDCDGGSCCDGTCCDGMCNPDGTGCCENECNDYCCWEDETCCGGFTSVTENWWNEEYYEYEMEYFIRQNGTPYCAVNKVSVFESGGYENKYTITYISDREVCREEQEDGVTISKLCMKVDEGAGDPRMCGSGCVTCDEEGHCCEGYDWDMFAVDEETGECI